MLRVVGRLRASPLRQVGYAFRHFVAAAAQATTSSSAIGTRLKAVAPGATIAELADPASSLFYVDKSDILPVLESSTRMAALLRPQRWGKSVLLQMIGAYYDVANKSKPIVNIPGGNTPLAHSFSILHLDLAEVARAVAFTGTEAEMRRATEEALNVQILWSLEQFAERYNMSGVDLSGPLSLVVRRVAAWAASRGAPLYVLVDEYDALLRTLAITSGDHAVETLAGRQGPLRQFFGRFKTLHDHGLLPRMFITGISPVGVDVMTTAFNCVTDVSHWTSFNSAVGFTEGDVRRAVAECLGYPAESHAAQLIVDTLRRWGNGYRFAAGLGATAGMFQTAMVTQLLGRLRGELAQTRNGHDPVPLANWLRSWAPEGAVSIEPEQQLLAYFTRSGAMDSLLPKLVSSTKQPIAVPVPLSTLRVEQQLQAATVPVSPARTAAMLSNWAQAVAGSTGGEGVEGSPRAATAGDGADAAVGAAGSMAGSSALNVREWELAEQFDGLLNAHELAEQTLVRTMYFEGLLTHVDSASGHTGLRVPNQAMQSRFVKRFAGVLAAYSHMSQAVDAFLLRGKTASLQRVLANVCRHGLSVPVLKAWHEFHCSERLALLLNTSSGIRFEWQREQRVQRIAAGSSSGYQGYADIVGRSGRRIIIIEVKQVNLAWDVNLNDNSELKKLMPADSNAKLPLKLASAVTKLSDEQLLRLAISKPTGESLAPRRQLTVAQLQKEAAEQAREYARGWQEAHGTHSSLELYTAVAVGPLRWLLHRVEPLQL